MNILLKVLVLMKVTGSLQQLVLLSWFCNRIKTFKKRKTLHPSNFFGFKNNF